MQIAMMQITLLYYVSSGQKACRCCQWKKPCCTWWHCNFNPKCKFYTCDVIQV